MVQFSKLRLSGFKSFADNTELDILPGLTGIVGPNGCGKSNLVEALRWMMGETSAKSLRGGGMDDVIFAGTAKRPARNFAEVSLGLQNPNRDAPDPYTHLDQIEISRRIDRGMGSDYRINGKVVRAADSALFFADTAAGAHSPSIVSQGRVSDLIHAKPADRRRVLEGAAAISGLHNRRKEAETRLRAAEKNLTRVDDLLNQKTARYEDLVKQAKQAERYRTLSDTIRRLEALTLTLEWQRVDNDSAAAQSAMAVANEAQNRAKQAMYDLGRERESLSAQWDALERTINELNTSIQNEQRNKERAEDEIRRYETTRADLESQIATLSGDNEYEVAALKAAQEKLLSLANEKAELEANLNSFTDQVETARAERDEAKNSYDEVQKALSEQRAEHASLNAQRAMLQQQVARLVADKNNLAAEQERITAILTQMESDLKNSDAAALSGRVSQLEETLGVTLDSVTVLEKQSESAALEMKSTAEALQAAQSALHRIDTEIKALAALAEAPQSEHDHDLVLDKITVTGGYEQALAVALGRELRAGLDSSAPVFWQARDGQNLPALPGNVPSLASVAKAPEALNVALAMIGVVETSQQGASLAAQLQPGQMLVSRDGHGWRWDGYTVTPEAQAGASERETKQLLEQRNRLVVLRDERQAAAASVEAAQAQYDAAQAAQNDLRHQTTEARNSLNQLQRDASSARQQLANAQQKQAELAARQQALQEKQADIAARLTQTDAANEQLQNQISELAPEAESQHRLHLLQIDAQKAEEFYREKDQVYSTIHTQQAQWQQRLNAIAADTAEWQQREQSATARLGNLAERLEKLNESLAALKSPDHVREQIAACDEKLAALNAEMFALNSQRTELTASRTDLDRRNQETQEMLMGAREALARAETQFQNAQEMRTRVIETSEQNFACAPDDVAAQFSFTDEDLDQNLQTLRAKQDKARNDRDRIGAVNLRAEEESQVLGAEIETLTAEKNDIVEAIEKLRTGISTLNRDARKKMLAVFDEVNERFKDTFTRLFNGGEAYLQLIDAEDPLEAGLEIYAQPPGKKLQTLTLLSGGEQSLTATALVFSMFLTNPTPICILDEIDAALDDANVERVCALLQDFAKTHPTRFLVITHNPITMASMDRLYGVTMVEKGVSKLVSVDLAVQPEPHLALAAE